MKFKNSDLDHIWFLLIVASQNETELTAQAVNYAFKKVMIDFMQRSGLTPQALRKIEEDYVINRMCTMDEHDSLLTFLGKLHDAI